MTSILSAFPYIGEQSFATPGAFNSPLSIISANIAAVNAATGSILSGGLSLGTQGLTITVPSSTTDYIFLNDSTNLRSSYAIGSFNTHTADGLNIWDASGNTMIVSFSKQSVRFYQQVVGPVFDVGGALADTLNAATFGTGSDSTESRIQAAINTASLAAVARVYVPASMYPYSSSSVSFINTVLMVREGGDWSVYDVEAYGANNKGVANAAPGIQAALNAARDAGGGLVTGGGRFSISTGLLLPNRVRLYGKSEGGTTGAVTGMVIAASSTFSNPFMIRNELTDGTQEFAWLEKIQLYGNQPSGASMGQGIYFLNGPFVDSCLRDVIVSNCTGVGIRISNTQAVRTSAIVLDNVWVNSNNSHGILIDGNVGNIWLTHITAEDELAGAAGIRLLGTGGASPMAGISLNDIHVEFNRGGPCAGVWVTDVHQLEIDGVFFGGGTSSGCTLVYVSGTTASRLLFRNLSGGLAAGPTVSLFTVLDDTINGYRDSTGFVGHYATMGATVGSLAAASGNTLSTGSFGVLTSALSTTGSASIAATAGAVGLTVIGATGQIASLVSGNGGGGITSYREGTARCDIGVVSANAAGYLGMVSNNSIAVRTNNTARMIWNSGGTIESVLTHHMSSDVVLPVGKRLMLKNGTNASFGTAVLGSNGSVNVATTVVTANSVIFLTDQTAGGTLGDIEIGGIRAGSGFTILSTSVTDTSTVGWLIIEPSP